MVIKSLSTVIAIALIFFILKYYMNFDFNKSKKELRVKSLKSIANLSMSWHKYNIDKKAVSKDQTFAGTKFYMNLEQIIFSLSLECTVESLLILIIVASLLGGFIILMLLHGVILTIISVPTIFKTIVAVLGMLASQNDYKKTMAKIDSKNFIVTNIDKGIYAAIQNCVDMLDESIRPFFEDFLEEKAEYQNSINESLDTLAEKLGGDYFEFIEKVKKYERTGNIGDKEAFNDILEKNNAEKRFALEIKQAVDTGTFSFTVCIAMVVFAFCILMLQNTTMLDVLFKTALGQCAVMINILFIVSRFDAIQKKRRVVR